MKNCKKAMGFVSKVYHKEVKVMVLIAGDIYKLGVRFWQLNFEFHKNK